MNPWVVDASVAIKWFLPKSPVDTTAGRCYQYAIFAQEGTAMAQILVRNLDKKTVGRLKQQAKRKGRSLQSEVKTIIEEATHEADMDTVWRRIEQFRNRLKGRKFSNSVELIREDRDR
jgi:plasmid stability protein